jgi:class 3 adenylate cyclase
MSPQESDVSHLLAKAQALSSRIAAVNEIAVAINCSLDLDQILQVVGKKAKWLLDFEHLSVYLCGDRSERFVTLFGSAVELSSDALDPTTGLIEQAIQSGEPQLIDKSLPEFLSHYTSCLIIPLENQNQKIGTINLATTQESAYSIDDIRIVYLLALQLASAITNAKRFEELKLVNSQLESEKQKSDQLLLNILPHEIAEELKSSGQVKPVHYESASVLFADLKDFTKVAECLTPEELFNELNECFSYFDLLIEKYNLEKIKMIGDSYMCAGGIPKINQTHAIDTILAALEMQAFMRFRKFNKIENNQPYWNLRIGIHSGSLVAGVIGYKKFAYDVWGDTVNVAARMESSGIPGKVNISGETYHLIQNFFQCEYRGKVAAKNKGKVDMYLINKIHPHLSLDPAGFLPNHNFLKLYLNLTDPTLMTLPPFCTWLLALE